MDKIYENKKNILFIKRVLDIIFAVIGIIIFSPIILFCAIIIKFNLGSPVIFTQNRVGKDEKIFKMMKFRTMKDIKDQHGNLLSDDKRLTRLGRILRELSIDELPELINILKGDMSLVGPRPLLVEYLPLYTEEQKKRHNVKPGLTGFAQVNGRNSISWNEKFKLDIWYVENWSLILDIKIIFFTFYKVLRKDGINQIGNVTVEKFNGKN